MPAHPFAVNTTKAKTHTKMYSKEELKQIRYEFWHKLESKSRRIPGQNGRPIRWIGDKTGVKGISLRFDATRDFVMVALEINADTKERQNHLIEKMLACKTVFENEFGKELVWDTEYPKSQHETVTRIYIKAAGDLYNKDLWHDMIYFMTDNMLRMEKAFKVVQDYLSLF